MISLLTKSPTTADSDKFMQFLCCHMLYFQHHFDDLVWFKLATNVP